MGNNNRVCRYLVACLQSSQVAAQVGAFLAVDGEEPSVQPSDDDVSGVSWGWCNFLVLKKNKS